MSEFREIMHELRWGFYASALLLITGLFGLWSCAKI